MTQIMGKKQPDIRLAVFSAIVLYPFFFVLFFFLLIGSWQEYEVEKAFKKDGVHTAAKLIGYQSVDIKDRRSPHSRPGDVPVLTYVTSDKITHRYLAFEYGATNSDLAKLKLSTKQIEITYLAKNPDTARVEDWRRDDSKAGLALSLVACVGLLVAELLAIRFVYINFRFKKPRTDEMNHQL